MQSAYEMQQWEKQWRMEGRLPKLQDALSKLTILFEITKDISFLQATINGHSRAAQFIRKTCVLRLMNKSCRTGIISWVVHYTNIIRSPIPSISGRKIEDPGNGLGAIAAKWESIRHS